LSTFIVIATSTHEVQAMDMPGRSGMPVPLYSRVMP
jgi:hypothetical protein